MQKFSVGGSDFEKVSIHKEMRVFEGKPYILVHSIKSDFAFVKGHVADELGNVVFNKSALNFNADVAKSAKTCIVEVEKIVPAGSLEPHHIQLPHIYVQRLIKGDSYEKPIEKYTIKKEGENASDAEIFKTEEGKIKKKISERAARMVKHGMYINLGIGIPTLIANFIDKNINVTFHSENGVLGLGEFPYANEVDADLINAGRQTVTIIKGGSYMTSSESFAMIRGGHLDITFLGGMQVSERGDLANWIIPGKMLKGMGGAMDLVAGTKKKVIVMQHSAKNGRPKILRDWSLPLTGSKWVDTLITEKSRFWME